MSAAPSKRAERFDLARVLAWPAMLAAILALGWQESVLVVIVLSVYANAAGDFSAYRAARAERRSLEHP